MKIKKIKFIVTVILGGTFVAAVLLAVFMVQLKDEGVNAVTNSSLNGKSVLFDGDSIAMGSYALSGETSAPRWSYANYLEENYGTENTNVSRGGARFYWPDYSDDSNCNYGQDCIIMNHLTSAIKNTNYDYLILEGGVNDLHFYYESNSTAYAAALREYFNTVTTNSKWVRSKIGFVIVPKPDYNRKYWYKPTLEKEFWEATQEICDEYSIEYINFFKQSSSDSFQVPSGFDWDMMDIDISNANSVGSFDGLHPSKGAHGVLGSYIADWMVTLPKYKYTVSFDSNGSSLSGATSQSVVHGKNAMAPTYTIDSGQMFEYWSENNNCNGKFEFNKTAIMKDTTLYACWEQLPNPANKYTLTFDNNGGTGGVASRTCNISGGSCTVTIPADTPTRTSYYFLGYADNANAVAVTYRPGGVVTLSANKTVYAVWANGDVKQDSGDKYEKGSGKDMVVSIDYPMEHLVKIMMDDEDVDNTNNDKYKVESGSTVITLYSKYLDELEPGSHVLQAVYNNDVVKEIAFVVEDVAVSVPDTAGDTKTITSPETGSNGEGSGNGGVALGILPVAIVVIFSILRLKCRQGHRRFEQ